MRNYYEAMSRVEGESELAKFVNGVLENLDMLRLMSGPKTFRELEDAERSMRYMSLFYYSTLWDKWLVGIVERIEEWHGLIGRYLSEYNGSWRYYAICNRLDCIRQYGGDDEDYDQDGNIIKEVSDEKLGDYSIFTDLLHDDWRDIVQNTKPEDLQLMFTALIQRAGVSITDAIKQVTGQKINLYKQDENGNMVVMSREEEQLIQQQRGYDAAYSCMVLYALARTIREMIDMMEKMEYDQNNYDDLNYIMGMCNRLLNMETDAFIGDEDIKRMENLIKE